MALGLLDPEASADLLCTLALGEGQPPSPQQRGQARELAADLGFLPLALEQAGAYMHQTGTDLGAYRRLLGEVLDTAADGIDPERTIARIWNHTLTAISGRDELAVTVLHTVAWLAPDDIPRTLLAPLTPDSVALGNALGALHAYNMIAFTADRQGITVHRLVQTVLRTRTPSEPGTHPPGRQEAEQAIHQAIHDEDEAAGPQSPQWERLLPHITALAESIPADNPASTRTAGTYHAAAQYLYRQGRDAHTIALRTAAASLYQQVLGDAHPQTLRSRNNLAGAYESVGDLGRAIPLYETTLTQSERVLGDTHPQTLASRNNLAYAYRAAGDLGRAISLFETTLTQCERVLGDTHPQTLTSRKNLASARRAAQAVQQPTTATTADQ
jgi:hypothetical protein